MKFGCDSCHAQYMISDQKVGPAGVRVRCKKCGFVIHVKPSLQEPEDATVVMSAEKVLQLQRDIGLPPPAALPKPTEDEIGEAFDSMFSGPAAPDESPAPPTEPENPAHEPDRVETRILGPSDVQKIASELGPGMAVAAAARDEEPTAAAPPPVVEWFAAIADEQVGPLDASAIGERWKRGELRPDSLVWRAGFSDWKPLSTVEELAALAPAPEEIPRLAPVRSVEVMAPEAPPEEAVAPAPVVAPPPEEPPAEVVDFRPSAAEALAALASMAQEEIAASAPAPAAASVPKEPASLTDARQDPLADLPPPAAAPGGPVLAATVEGASAPRSFGASDGRGRFGGSERAPLRLALVVGGATLAGIVLAVALGWFLYFKPQQERQREWQRAQDQRLAALAASAALAQKSAPPKVPAAAAPAPAVAAAPAAPVQPAAPAAPAVAPSAAPAVAQAPAPAPERSRERASAQGGRGRHQKRSRQGGGERASAAPAEVASAAPASAPQAGGDDFLGGTGGGGIDKEFARELDGKGAAGSERSGDLAPPADAAPASLSQADVLSVVRDHTSTFLHCKDQHPPGGGRIVMHWRIKPDGRTVDVRRSGGDLDNPALAACLKTAVGRMRFGPSRSSMPVDFPFDF